MFAYCLGELRLSEETAYKRIQAARTARRFPAIFDAVAEGRLHLTAVVLLKPYLTSETVNELLAAATHKSKSEIEKLLACKFPKPDVMTRIAAIPAVPPALATAQLDPDPVPICAEPSDELDPDPAPVATNPSGLGPVKASPERLVPEPVQIRSKISPLAPRRFALQVTIGQITHDKLRYAQEPLSHQIPSGDVAEVLDRALDALILKLEKTKFAATDKPRKARRNTGANERHIPSHVKRAVRKRDGGQCTYVSANGQRCSSRRFLEFDHAVEVARGGQATPDQIRLRCRAHNQFTAEQTFGVEFMKFKREQARATTAARVRTTALAEAEARQSASLMT